MVCYIEAGTSGLPEYVSRTLRRTSFTSDNIVGRPVYEGEDDVVLYYWEESGWPTGWWLGLNVGGDQVFAYNSSDSYDAPTRGWRCPWHKEINTSFEIHHEHEPSEPSERSIDPYTSWLALLQFCSGVSSKAMFEDREKFQDAFAQFLKFKELMLSGPFASSELIEHIGNFYEEKEIIDEKVLPVHAPENLLTNARSVIQKDVLRILAFEATNGNKLLSSELSVVAKVLAHFRFEKDFSKGVHILINNLKALGIDKKKIVRKASNKSGDVDKIPDKIPDPVGVEKGLGVAPMEVVM